MKNHKQQSLPLKKKVLLAFFGHLSQGNPGNLGADVATKFDFMTSSDRAARQ